MKISFSTRGDRCQENKIFPISDSKNGSKPSLFSFKQSSAP